MDTLGQFIEDCCKVDKTFLKKLVIYIKHIKHGLTITLLQLKVLGMKSFSQKMEERFC